MSGSFVVSKKIQKYDELSGKNVSIDEKNAYLYGWDDDSERYSKHYYAGTQRMASRVEFMPKGMGEEPQQPEQPSGQTEPQSQSEDTGEGEGEASGQPSKEEKEALKDYSNMQNIQVSNTGSTSDGAETSEVAVPDLYYYHTDHLGSTSIITDRNGEVAQYLAYTPYGETFIEERDVTPYKFNGKELDAETGLYYYGARYYDPSAALWLGVDPLAEKYPDVSPYVYCHGNPVRLIDPTGMEDEEANSMTIDKMYPNMLNEVVVQGEGSHQQQFDQPYGETVTGGMGQGSQSTSNFHGPSIDASDLPQNFGGEGSKGMQFIYNLVKRVGQLVENMFGGNGNSSVVSGEKGAHYSVIKNESDIEEYIKYYPVIQGSYNDNGIIR